MPRVSDTSLSSTEATYFPFASEEARTHPSSSALRAGRQAIRIGSHTAAVLLLVALIGNAAAVLWLWLHGGGVSIVHDPTALWTSLGRLTGLEGAYLALVQIVLLLRMPWLERLVGFDRLTRWHRVNGQACIVLVVAHAVLITVGYAGMDQVGFGSEFGTLLSDYPGMVAATVGTGMMVFVGLSSLVIARRRLPYELWYGIHVTIYAGIALAYLHQIPTGNDLTVNPAQADYWIALYCSVLALIVAFRVIGPISRFRRHGLRVDRVERESDDVISVYVRGRNLRRLGARGGQFFIWRFLGRGLWWQAHPFSISAAPDGQTLRLTVKAVGGYTRALGAVKPGTRVLIDGPLGRFTADRRRRDRVALIAGGIGVTPLRAILEEFPAGDIVFVHRVAREADAVLGGEIDGLAEARGARVVRLVGDHRDPRCKQFLSAAHLAELIPDLSARDVFVCGPPPMMSRTIDSLRSVGVPRAQIHSERFALAS
jgi:predicted ferric reductase